MIVQKDFLNKIKDFGLNSYEAKLWTALLSRGTATAGELSDIANVPRSRSYDVLESLERKGFVIMRLGKPIKYIAVSPAEVLERVKKFVLDDADRQSKTLEKLRKTEVFTELNALHKQGVDTVDPMDLSGVIKGRGNIYSYLNSLFKNSKNSIIIMTTDTGFAKKAESLKNSLNKAKERGVKIKILAPISKTNKSAVNVLSKCASIKNNTDFTARFCVIDNKNVIFMALDDKTAHPNYDFGVWVKTDFFASSFINIFNKFWTLSRTVK
ncbi:TrmB family transcriptional regulator [Candidatus Woesearchaeota archaeon]|nr:TrmB family transcriptional regulator [Candidatus Woesearchaeota archaeon]